MYSELTARSGEKGHHTGTLIFDAERRATSDLLSGREAATIAARLTERPSIEIIARDRGDGSGVGALKGRLEAAQVADRRHLFESANVECLLVVKRHMRDALRAFGHGLIDAATLTAAERL